jgi:hypothetical protein
LSRIVTVHSGDSLQSASKIIEDDKVSSISSSVHHHAAVLVQSLQHDNLGLIAVHVAMVNSAEYSRKLFRPNTPLKYLSPNHFLPFPLAAFPFHVGAPPASS